MTRRDEIGNEVSAVLLFLGRAVADVCNYLCCCAVNEMEFLVTVIYCLEKLLSKNQMLIAVYSCRRVASGSKVAQLSVNRNGTIE